jgi:hypothetical protein
MPRRGFQGALAGHELLKKRLNIVWPPPLARRNVILPEASFFPYWQGQTFGWVNR